MQERRFRVLLADDNFDMREYVTKLLSERYDVTTASNGTASFLSYYWVRPVLAVVMRERAHTHFFLCLSQGWKRWPWCSSSPSTSC